MAAITDFKNKCIYFSYEDDGKEKFESITAHYKIHWGWETLQLTAYGCSYKHATDNLKDIIKKCIEKMSEIIED